MQRHQVELQGRELRPWLEARRRARAGEWDGVAGLNDYVLRLTPDQTRAAARPSSTRSLDRWRAARADREPRPRHASWSTCSSTCSR